VLRQQQGDFDQLLKDVKRAATDKLVQQVDETLRRGLNFTTETPTAIFPVVVVGSPFSINPLLVAEIEKDIAAASPAIIGVDQRCRPPVILDLNEFSALLQVCHATRRSVPDLLDEWLRSPLGANNSRDWLVTDGPGRTLPGGGAISGLWMDRLRRRVFRQDGEGPA
jgi:hypothetical protein